MGLIWKWVDDAKFTREIERLVRHFAKRPAHGLGCTKAIYASPANSLDAQLDLEQDFIRELCYGRDYREAVEAFMAKREPVFTGEWRRRASVWQRG